MKRLFISSTQLSGLTFLIAATLLFPLLVGCDGPASNSPQAQAGESRQTEAEPSDAATPAEAPNHERAPLTPSSEESVIESILGTQEEGWLPRAVADLGLKQGMTPEEVAAIIPGADELGDYGVSTVGVNDIPGLTGYKFNFLELQPGVRTLNSITLVFDPVIKAEYSFEQLIEEFSKKYGEYTPGSITDISVIWSSPDFHLAQLANIGTELDGNEFEIEIPR